MVSAGLWVGSFDNREMLRVSIYDKTPISNIEWYLLRKIPVLILSCAVNREEAPAFLI